MHDIVLDMIKDDDMDLKGTIKKPLPKTPEPDYSQIAYFYSEPAIYYPEPTFYPWLEKPFEPNPETHRATSHKSTTPFDSTRTTPFGSTRTTPFGSTRTTPFDSTRTTPFGSTTPLFQSETHPTSFGLNLASCSLVEAPDLYRRMAFKTKHKSTQMAYATYLIEIARLYPDPTQTQLLREAHDWIDRLAKAGFPEALMVQARRDPTKSLRAFLKASKAGALEADYELGQIWSGRGRVQKAVLYYQKAAKGNHTLSIYKLAMIWLCGARKVKKDIYKGFDYLIRAADMNDKDSSEPAFVLGCIYADELDRIGLEKQEVQSLIDCDNPNSMALKYLSKSSELGHADAICFMGHIYETGKLVQPVDLWQAYQYYKKAAELNHPLAMLDLSRLYHHGIYGLLHSQKNLAFEWCKRSADLGFDQAEYKLGQYYEEGIGVFPNMACAVEYFGRAASKGHPLAAEKLNHHLTDNQIKKSQSIPHKTSLCHIQ